MMKENLKIEGRVISHNGIPKSLIDRFGREYINSMRKKYPDMSIDKYINGDEHYDASNLILDEGKKLMLKKLFGQAFGGQEIVFNKMVIGDGSHAFGVDAKPILPPSFPAHADTSLENFIVGKDVDFVSDFRGNPDEGYEKSIVCTFFSHIDTDLFTIYSPNNSDNLINETALCMTETGGVYTNFLAKHTMRNFPFKVVNAVALTIEWVIRVL